MTFSVLLRKFAQLRDEVVNSNITQDPQPNPSTGSTRDAGDFTFSCHRYLAFKIPLRQQPNCYSYLRLSACQPELTKDVEAPSRQSVAASLRPRVGIVVTQVVRTKARSIKHCCQMAASRRMSVEHKYDGEYCQIHIELSKGKDSIRIFSKSGFYPKEDDGIVR